MVSALLISFVLTQSPTAGATGVEGEADAKLKGFDLSLTVFNSSGVYFGEGGYSNSFTLWVEPSWAFGKMLFKGTWFDKLNLTARIPVEAQVAGNDPRFNSTGYASRDVFLTPGTLGTPEAAATGRAQASGPRSNGALLGDMFLQLAHGRLFTIPGAGVSVSASIRSLLPTSTGSRNAGFIASLGPGLILERTFFERLSLGYMARPTYFFYSRTQGSIAPLGTPVTINGNSEATWTPSSTGEANPQFMMVNGLWATFELPKGFSLSAMYFLFNTKPYDVTGGCNPIGMAGVDVCRDGLGRPGAWRDEQWFLASVDWHYSFLGVSLGVSTFRPLRTLDGRLAQPFFESTRDNHTTLYLSFSANAEGIAAAIAGPKEPKQ